MKTSLPKLFLFMLLFSSIASSLAAQCSGGLQVATIYPTLNTQTTSALFAGSYVSLNASAGVTYEFSFCTADGGSQNFNTELTILDGNGQYAGAYNNDYCGTAAKLTWTCTNSGFYRILVTIAGCQTNFTQVAVMAYRVIAPSNDLCLDAVPLTIPSVTLGNTSFAQQDFAPSCVTSDGASGGVWYTVTGTGGIITASLCSGTNYDSRLRVFSGGCGNLSCVTGNDDYCSNQSQASWCSVAGRTYYILVHGWLTASGSFKLTLSSTAATPVPSASASISNICAGDSVILAASGCSSYTWSPAASVVNPNSAVTTAFPASSTNYVVAGYDNASGCTQYDTVSIHVNQLPLVMAAGFSPVCPLDTVEIIASGANTYSWAHGPATSTVSVVAYTTQSYVVTGTDVNGCSATDTFTLVVHPGPAFAIAGVTQMCFGDTVTLTASGTAVSYQWSTGDNTSSITVSPPVSTTYTVTGTSADGCSIPLTVPLAVHPNPTLSVSYNSTICAGDTTAIHAFSSAQNFSWQPGGEITSSIYVSPAASSAYSVTCTSAQNCSTSMQVTINVAAVPVVTASIAVNPVCVNGNPVPLISNPAGGTWLGAGINGSNFDPALAGVGTHDLVYSFTDGIGCTGSDTVQATVDACMGIDEMKTSGIANVFPNPGNGNFYLVSASDAAITVNILDMNGRSVYTNRYANMQAGVPVELNASLASGIYFVQITDGNALHSLRLVVTGN